MAPAREGPDPQTRRALVLRPLRDRGPVAPGAPGRGRDDAGAGAVPEGHGYGDPICQPHLLALPDRPFAATAAAADQGEAVGAHGAPETIEKASFLASEW